MKGPDSATSNSPHWPINADLHDSAIGGVSRSPAGMPWASNSSLPVRLHLKTGVCYDPPGSILQLTFRQSTRERVMSRFRTNLTCCCWMILLSSVALSGCALGRSSLSIDSNSRSPWLGLELIPGKKPADPANYHRSIAQHRSQPGDQAEIQAAIQKPKKESRLPGWLNPMAERTPLPLPRTDVEPPPFAEKSTATSNPDWWGF